MALQVEFIDERVRCPRKRTRASAGHDFFAPARTVIPPGGDLVTLTTGLKLVKMPINTFLQLEGKSELAFKGLWVHSGIIDSVYRGEILVLVRNFSSEPIIIEKGQAFVQGVMRYVLSLNFVLAEDAEIPRGSGGFGSATLQANCSHCQCKNCEKEKVSRCDFNNATLDGV